MNDATFSRLIELSALSDTEREAISSRSQPAAVRDYLGTLDCLSRIQVPQPSAAKKWDGRIRLLDALDTYHSRRGSFLSLGRLGHLKTATATLAVSAVLVAALALGTTVANVSGSNGAFSEVLSALGLRPEHPEARAPGDQPLFSPGLDAAPAIGDINDEPVVGLEPSGGLDPQSAQDDQQAAPPQTLDPEQGENPEGATQGNGVGQGGIPPGQGGENPGNGGGQGNGIGQGGIPPGQGGENPGNGADQGNGVGQNGTPQGQGGESPGNGGGQNNGVGPDGVPPGQANPPQSDQSSSKSSENHADDAGGGGKGAADKP